jgi:DNA polymerase III epsilon subunit-like protein
LIRNLHLGKIVKKTNWENPKHFRELVQIGAIKVKNSKIVDTLNLFLFPKINPKLSKYFTNLAGITNNMLQEKGFQFKNAIEIFYKFSSKYDSFSYGNDYSIIKKIQI